MLFTELPLEILINIFDFVFYLNKFQILKLRILNKFIYNVTQTFLKLKRNERKNFNFVLFWKKIKHPKNLKLLIDFIFSFATNGGYSDYFLKSNYKIIINDCFDEEWLDIYAPYNTRNTIKITKLGKLQKISSLNFGHCSSNVSKFKNFRFPWCYRGSNTFIKFKICSFEEGFIFRVGKNLYTNCKIYKKVLIIPYSDFFTKNLQTFESFIKNNTFFNSDNQEIDFTKYEEKMQLLFLGKCSDFEIEGFNFVFKN